MRTLPRPAFKRDNKAKKANFRLSALSVINKTGALLVDADVVVYLDTETLIEAPAFHDVGRLQMNTMNHLRRSVFNDD